MSWPRRGNERVRRFRRTQRRALLRRLERVASQLERTPQYRRSLQRVLRLGSELEAVLDPTQRERWLALEEALFDHSARLHQAYFFAGVEYGQSKALAALLSNAKTAPSAAAESAPSVHEMARAAAPPSAAERSAALEQEIVSALVRWLGKLLRD